MSKGYEERKKWRERLEQKGKAIKNDPKTKLRPKCIAEGQDITLSSQGYFTPCCWLDDELYWHQPWIEKFYSKHLNITNNEDIKDILCSKEWIDFYNMLRNNPDLAPPVCYEYCSDKIITNKIVTEDDNVIVRIKH